MPIPPEFTLISDYVYYYADTLPKRDALVFGNLRIDYAGFAKRVRQCARALLAAGIRKGDRVAMLSTPRPEFLTALLATADVGAIWVGLNPRARIEEMRHIIGDSRPKIIISMTGFEDRSYLPDIMTLSEEFDFVERIITLGGVVEGTVKLDDFLDRGNRIDSREHEDARNVVDALDPAMIVYTAGTTGRPKGALLKHYGLVCRPRANFLHRYTDHQKMICNLPINHVGGVATTCCVTYIGGGTIYFMERFDPAGVLALIQKEGITHWCAVVTMFQLTVSLPDFHDYDLTSLEWIIWGGAPMPKTLIHKLGSCGAKLGTQYGMTETVGPVSLTDPEADVDILAETVGRLDSSIEMRIVDQSGRICQPGKEGEIQVRHNSVMSDYLNQPGDTKETFTPGGFFKTGDVGILRPDGNLRLVGRIKEMFKSGAYNVYPREIELAIESHPAVALAAVIGVPDDVYQEVGHAFILAGPDRKLSEDEMRDWCRRKLSNYKVPKRFFILEELPLLPIGKIDKQALKKNVINEEDRGCSQR